MADVGRPTDYKPEYATQAYDLCRIGAIDEDLALYFNVCVATIGNWKNAQPEFLEAIKKGKAETDRGIGGKLIDRASGAEWYEEKEVKLKSTYYDDQGRKCEKEEVKIVQVRKAAPPDVTALIFFLKNRRPDLWRDKQEIQHSGTGTGITFEIVPVDGPGEDGAG